MIAIDSDTLEILGIRDKIFDRMKVFFGISSDENSKRKNNLQKLYSRNNGLYREMIKFFHDDLENIIKCKPKELRSMHEAMLDEVKFDKADKTHAEQFELFFRTMENYYKAFFQEKMTEDANSMSVGRWLSKNLKTPVCPFCNHNYTLTVDDGDKNIVIKPDFDHFYPKSKYPLLALSFFNLIPICHTCNKLKGTDEIAFSPYDNSLSSIVFEIYGMDKNNDRTLFGLGSAVNDVSIVARANYSVDSGKSCNIRKLGLEQVYEFQVDYVKDIIDKAQQYHMGSYTAMIESFNGLGKSEADIDRIIWSVYKEDNHRRPLSKLTSDVLDQIGLS